MIHLLKSSFHAYDKKKTKQNHRSFVASEKIVIIFWRIVNIHLILSKTRQSYWLQNLKSREIKDIEVLYRYVTWH